jgi:hypothetical protein
VAANPEYKEAYYQLGFVHRRRGDREAAERALARFQELSAQARP